MLIIATDSCTRAAAIVSPVPPNFPSSALRMTNGAAQTIILVSLDATGQVVEEHVTQSSGVLALDQAALQAAKESKYTPRIVDCRPATGRYVFKVTFSK